jgi:hypothetical protein
MPTTSLDTAPKSGRVNADHVVRQRQEMNKFKTMMLVGVLGLIMIVGGCKLPAPSCYLLPIVAPKIEGSKMFERTALELQTNLKLQPQRIDKVKWESVYFSLPNRVEVGLFHHKKSGGVFISLTQWDRKDNEFSKDAAALFDEIHATFSHAAAPFQIRKSCKWREIEKMFGDDVYSR